MGYSVYASRIGPPELSMDDGDFLTEEDLQAFRAARIRLCGLSHKNPTHFEGWYYYQILLDITGMSLDPEDGWVPPEQVRKGHESLMRAKENERSGTSSDLDAHRLQWTISYSSCKSVWTVS